MATSHLLRESAAIMLAGVVVGLAANALSPRGISLTRDYFAGASASGVDGAATPSAGQPATHGGSGTTESPPPARSKRGLVLATHEDVVRWFNDPAHDEQRILFVDARDDARYAAGHIPGALPFDHYRPERDLAPVLGAAALAERIVVYCNGGACEDSELAVLDLIALGVPTSKLVIYAGGMTAWAQHGLPVEKSKPTPGR